MAFGGTGTVFARLMTPAVDGCVLCVGTREVRLTWPDHDAATWHRIRRCSRVRHCLSDGSSSLRVLQGLQVGRKPGSVAQRRRRAYSCGSGEHAHGSAGSVREEAHCKSELQKSELDSFGLLRGKV